MRRVRTVRTSRAGRSGGGRRLALVGTAALACVAALGLTGSVAVADPPTDDDVAAAQAAVTDAAGRIAQLEVQLAQLSTVADGAQTAVQVAGEEYAGAQVALDQARADADEAQRQADASQADLDAARRDLAAVAMQAYRNGGDLQAIQALLSADGFEEVLQRQSAIDVLGGKADRAVQRYRAAETVAGVMQARASDAVATRTAAEQAAADALAKAQGLQQDAASQVADAQSQRDAALTELATLRQTSVQVEREHQDAVDAERARRAEETAQATRLAQAAATSPPAPAGTGGTGTTKGQGGSGGAQPSPSPTPSSQPTSPAATAAPGPSSDPAPVSDPPSSGGGTSRGTAEQGAHAVQIATSKVGIPYVFGGASDSGYDCSGLTSMAWGSVGVSIKRSSRDQYLQVKKIAYADLRPGDLVFWATNPSNPSTIYHVAMWMGNNTIVEGNSVSMRVGVYPMRWSGTMPYAGRP